MLFIVGAIVGIGAIVKGIDLINSGAVAGIDPGTSIWSVPTLGSDVSWWSIVSIGVASAVVMIFAYWPAWSTEQTPWQKIWIARDVKSSRKGTFVGLLMVFLVYASTVLMAVGAWVIVGAPGVQAADFNRELVLYMLIAKIMPGWIIPVIIIGFLAAAMSNISNFAVSSASCLTKDIYQRYFRPHATQKEMVFVSRLCIAVTLAIGIVFGFVMPSILDAVQAAASIATCGYAVPIFGALYWRRGNAKGAFASMVLGGGGFVVTYIGQTWLGWVLPIDAVVIWLAVSVVAYVAVSLLTGKPESKKLAIFFKDDAKEYIEMWQSKGYATEPTTESLKKVNENIVKKVHGERAMYSYTCRLNKNFTTYTEWEQFVDTVVKNESWVWVSGYDIIYKITNEDMLSNVRMARGHNSDEVMLYCEPWKETAEASVKAIALAVDDLTAI